MTWLPFWTFWWFVLSMYAGTLAVLPWCALAWLISMRHQGLFA